MAKKDQAGDDLVDFQVKFLVQDYAAKFIKPTYDSTTRWMSISLDKNLAKDGTYAIQVQVLTKIIDGLSAQATVQQNFVFFIEIVGLTSGPGAEAKFGAFVPPSDGTYVKLKIKEATISPVGDLKIKFNKRILRPKIFGLEHEQSLGETSVASQIAPPQRQPSPPVGSNGDKKRRVLFLSDINDVIELSVRENTDDDALVKTIENFSVLNNTANDDTELNINLVFTKIDDITLQIREPDVLDVKILMPEIFIDAENLEPLSEPESFISLEIQPQMTRAEYEEMLSVASTASAIGMGLSIW